MAQSKRTPTPAHGGSSRAVADDVNDHDHDHDHDHDDHDDALPMRAELFSVGQLEQHARKLAAWHELSTSTKRRSDQLLPRLANTERMFERSYALITDAVGRGRRITPAAEWFIDNYPLIEEQIRTARRHLPRGYSRELPQLDNPTLAGTPRVYDLALELISHSDGRVDEQALHAFVVAYQSVAPLRLGELWAIPIMLRLALLENLRRVVASITAGRRQRERARAWMKRMIEVAARHPEDVVVVLAEMIRENPPLTDAFVSELATRLQAQGSPLAIASSWLDHRIAERGQTVAQVFQLATQSQAKDQVAIGNSIGGLRFLSATDWQAFVEGVSVVDETLRGDPADVYRQMDFETRDRYRHAVEALARYTKAGDERVVAAAAVSLAAHAQQRGDAAEQAHVGYWLVDDGHAVLADAVGGRGGVVDALRGFGRGHALPLYVGSIAALSLTATMAVARVWTGSDAAPWLVAVVVPLLLLATSQLGTALVQWAVTLRVAPRLLSRLDFEKGIPPGHDALVAVPALLTDIDEVDALVDALELRFLANRDPQLSYALLTDLKDAAAAATDDDAALVARAVAGITRLNARYAATADVDDDVAHHARSAAGPFFLLHRARRFNPQEGVWMGWERKRGKLEELNATLRGARDRFDVVVGDLDALEHVRFVIALDSDTQLPRDAGRLLVATLAHPLNRPVYDDAAGRVVRGYSILQPRVGVSMASAARTPFARLFAGEPGIDPYSRAVSDVYQDLFDEGSFIGKGIYDVDSLQRSIGGRFPENRVLSHDLLEGAYGRCGLVSDVLLIEEQPASHRVDLSRRGRWIRGDWQIASWLLPRVPVGAGDSANSLSALSRFKILDNLRRSLVPPALLALLVLGFSTAASAATATAVVLAMLALPGLFASATAFARRPTDVSWRRFAPDVVRELGRQLVRDVLALAWLPADAALSLGAIVRAAVRLLVTHRLMLEWRTANDAARAARSTLAGAFRSLWPTSLAALLVIACLVARQAELIGASADPVSFLVALPIAVLWALAPAVAWWMGEPTSTTASRLADDDVAFLAKVARRTWRFFAVFAGEEDNHLAPDNVQEDPDRGVAHRTSPTNIGMGLTATLAAYDFGYVGAVDVVARTTRTLATLDRLERHRGHFVNWYDTRTLEPLRPLYISTVDSGNLAGHLLVLAAGLDGIGDDTIVHSRLFDGLRTTLALYVDACARADVGGGHHEARDALTALLATGAGAASLSASLSATQAALARVAELASSLPRQLAPGVDDERGLWADALAEQAGAALADLRWLAPWITLDARAGVDIESRDRPPTLRELAARAPASRAVDTREHVVDDAAARACARLAELHALAARCRAFAEMDVGFLYDPARRLLSLGWNVADDRADHGFYDLLASEARLASFVAIAQGRLAQDHWFSLGRSLTTSGGKPALLSWSGSMFEYLMPLLIMPTYPHTLLDETFRGVVQRHIEYGRALDVPWGVSESGYLKTDAQQNYQYQAFGVPGLGYKRGLAADVVVAPYASAMALMVDPIAATANLRRLALEGRLGTWGFYEAIDYTAARLPPGKSSVTVKSFMAHHQGMTFLSLAWLLLDQPMQKRFLAEPALRATELLLQERVPRTLPIYPHPAEVSSKTAPAAAAGYRVFTTPSTPRPEVHLLSNGSYHVAVTNAGGGYSRWRDLAVTRWREDPTRDCWGTFLYLRDVDSGAFWSAAHQPTLQRATRCEAVFSQGRAELRRFDGDIETTVEIAVSPEDDVELRRVSITNRGRTARTIEVTSYAEVVLAPAAADAAHPAFSNLFVQTELLREQQAILCTRRPRSGTETPPTMLHLMALHGAGHGAGHGAATGARATSATSTTSTTSYETAREAFVGRGRSVVDPIAMHRPSLSNSEGSVLDPIVAVRNVVVVEPHQTVRLHIVTGVCETRERALTLVDKYRDPPAAERALELSWTHSQVLLRRLDTTEADVQLYERLASNVLYGNPAMRAPESVLLKNQRGQSGLWGYGISGDLPIVLVRIGDLGELALVQHILKAHAYWRLKGLIVDVVIWNEDPSGYRQVLQEQIMALVGAVDGGGVDRPGGVFIRRGDQMSEEDKTLIQAVARVVVSDTAGPLAEQMERQPSSLLPPSLSPTRDRRSPPATRDRETATIVSGGGGARVLGDAGAAADLSEHNGIGGFTRDGREYVITTSRSQRTPAPWVNVIANPWFGTVVSESGSAYTWCENAHSNRLTPWNNDPVGDASGEAVYIRDDDDGDFWSPTPLPAGDAAPYRTRHGFGYSVFEHEHAQAAEEAADGTARGIVSELMTFVAVDAPLKFLVLKLKNGSGRTRHLSVTALNELVLGATRPQNIPHIVTATDVRSGALLATNPYNGEFARRVAFLDASETVRSVSGDRTEVLGRNGTLARPAFLSRTRLSGRVGAGLDPVLALQVDVELADGQEREVAFTFGSGRDKNDALHLIGRFRGIGAAHHALSQVWDYWNRTLGALHVQTPDESLNFLANGWLVYQVLAARMWARSGFYQSGGAFGFRDQLQDAMSLVHAEPALLREQILRCAGRQFVDGDVQHWWHPPLGRGVRTRISDDYLWLPYATCRYVDALGDVGVLDEVTPFLEGRAVKPDEDSYYDLPGVAAEGGSLYEHCVRAIRHGLRFGVHGLPLMGTGDWNDGMNLVGDHGRGESVWLGFFLADVLQRFEPIARRRGDDVFADLCLAEAAALQRNLEEHAWDGGWYRRAWFDDGAPLGSTASPECQIDALPQSWSVLSGVGDPARSKLALAAVDARLVKADLGIIQLFDPPFNGGGPEPGYIRGYVPGVRENGGQYTHAAVWTVMAFAAAGDVERAWELFALINPVQHGNSRASMERYKVEPYVVAADVYTNAQHAGRGGWTWYTGSAGWMYRLITESLLGIHLEVDRLRVSPRLPAAWPSIDIHYRHHDTVHHIHVRNHGKAGGGGGVVTRVVSDGVEQATLTIPLHSDRQEHWSVIDVSEE